MELYVNEYQYTADVISESTAAWWRRRYGKGYWNMLAVSILLVVICVITRKIVFIALEIMPLLVVLMLRLKEKRAADLERDRMKVIFKDTIPAFRVEVGEDILMVTPQTKTQVSFGDVEDVFETKHLIILVVKGSMTVALNKDGFRQGDAEGCLKYLKSKLQK